MAGKVLQWACRTAHPPRLFYIKIWYKKAKVETSVLIDENGTILEVKTEISKKILPEAVQNTLKTDFAGYEVEEVEKIESNGVIKYEMEAEKGKEEFELVFDANRKLISKEVEKED